MCVTWFYKLWSYCPLFDSKFLVTGTSSTFLARLTWIFAYAFVMKWRCARYNIYTRHFTNYGVSAPYSTLNILWRELSLHCFPDWLEILHTHWLWNEDVCDIVFIRILLQRVFAPYLTLKIFFDANYLYISSPINLNSCACRGALLFIVLF